MTRRRWLRWLRGGLALAFLVGLALVVWPVRLGGAATFVVVRGHSMEGTYAQGDLLYARTSGSYAVGDVAVYRIPKGKPGAGALVVHRIKAINPDGTYLFQGDNKPSPDDVTPSRADLVAKPIVDLSGVPTRAIILAPLVFTIVAGVAVTVALWPTHHEDDAARPDDADAEPDDTESDRDAASDDDPDDERPTRRERRQARRPWGPRPAPFATPEPAPAPDPARIG